MSRQETAPLCIAEAMAAGKPVVSNRICGIPYMVDDGVTGLLAEAGDIEGFARHMSRLLADPAGAAQMGLAGREKALRLYHPDRVAEETLRVYHLMLAER
jgi:glycosyltransferase involved in cell wall biosynthesis